MLVRYGEWIGKRSGICLTFLKEHDVVSAKTGLQEGKCTWSQRHHAWRIFFLYFREVGGGGGERENIPPLLVQVHGRTCAVTCSRIRCSLWSHSCTSRIGEIDFTFFKSMNYAENCERCERNDFSDFIDLTETMHTVEEGRHIHCCCQLSERSCYLKEQAYHVSSGLRSTEVLR